MVTINSVIWIVITVITTILYTSTMEWLLHRFVMHKPVKIRLLWKTYTFQYPFQAHAVVHHGIFKADSTYHLRINHDIDKKTIPMAWWNGPLLTVIGTVPFVILSMLLGLWINPWLIIVTAGCTIFTYYCTYEYIHWCMHLPKKRRIEQLGVFYFLNGHHLLHHRNMGKNFNVVLPFADWLFGTLIVRSTLRFPQASGPSVPDVQPEVKLLD